MSAPLPAFWSEEKDPKGRTYYSNHATQETTWEVSANGEQLLGGQQEAAPFFVAKAKETKRQVDATTTAAL